MGSAAREAARRLQCQNNLKQISLALHNYADTNGCFPPGIVADYLWAQYWNVFGEAAHGSQGTSWMLRILAFLEQGALYDRWDFSINVLGNITAAQTDIHVFYCPTRRSAIRSEDIPVMFQNWERGGTDYGGCVGAANFFIDNHDNAGVPCSHEIFQQMIRESSFTTPAIIAAEKGIFGVNETTKFRDVRDGTSNTLLTGEVQRLYGLPYGGSTAPPCHHASQDGWAQAGVANLFDTDLGSVTANPGGINNWFYESAGSEHVGGAFFGIADASVRFINEDIDTLLYEALGTIAGGEVVSVPD